MDLIAVTVDQNDSCFGVPMEAEMSVKWSQVWAETENEDSKFR